MNKPNPLSPDDPNYVDPTASLSAIRQGNRKLQRKTARGYRAVNRALSRRSRR